MSFQSVSKCEGATFDCVSSIKVEEEDVVSGHLYVSPESVISSSLFIITQHLNIHFFFIFTEKLFG